MSAQTSRRIRGGIANQQTPYAIAYLSYVYTQHPTEGALIEKTEAAMFPIPFAACQDSLVEAKLIENPLNPNNGQIRAGAEILTKEGEDFLERHAEGTIQQLDALATKLTAACNTGTNDKRAQAKVEKDQQLPKIQRAKELIGTYITKTSE